MQVTVDGADLTAAAAGLGMDPFDLLVPVNRLVATATPHTVPIARCGACAYYDCSGTDVTITRAGDEVRWEWLGRFAPPGDAVVTSPLPRMTPRSPGSPRTGPGRP